MRRSVLADRIHDGGKTNFLPLPVSILVIFPVVRVNPPVNDPISAYS